MPFFRQRSASRAGRAARRTLGLSLAVAGLAWTGSVLAETTPDQAFGLQPVQADVDIDKPTKEQIAACAIVEETFAGAACYSVKDNTGRLWRRFVDSNGDGRVDQWCYFKDGIEAYRDIDANFNGKTDEYRWLGVGGTRRGLDPNEDRLVDTWAEIEPSEISRELISAMRTRDAGRIEALLLSEQDLDALELPGPIRQTLIARRDAAAEAITKALASRGIVGDKTIWVDFGLNRPARIPAGTRGLTTDLTMYDNSTVIIENDGRHAQILLGPILKVGKAWRMIDAPMVLSEVDAAAMPQSLLFQIALENVVTGDGSSVTAANDKMRDLTEAVSAVDRQLDAADDAGKQALYARRAALVEQVIAATTQDEDRANWIKQYADILLFTGQVGFDKEAASRLDALSASQEKGSAKSPTAVYVKYRKMVLGHNLALATAKEDEMVKLQDDQQKALKQFVDDNPTSEDAPDAIMQIASAEEFAGHTKEASEWYARIAKDFPRNALAGKAGGAVRRLSSDGRPFALRAATIDGRSIDLAAYKGKVVLVHYWATWCKPCKDDMGTIRSMLDKYGKAGFEAVGVNLDEQQAEAIKFLKTNRLPWAQVYEPGGMNSRPAVEMGIVSLPTMLLIDDKGNVITRGVTGGDLETELKKLFR